MKTVYKILKFLAALVFALFCIALLIGLAAALVLGAYQFITWQFFMPELIWFRIWAVAALVFTIGLMFDKDSEGTRLWRKMID